MRIYMIKWSFNKRKQANKWNLNQLNRTSSIKINNFWSRFPTLIKWKFHEEMKKWRKVCRLIIFRAKMAMKTWLRGDKNLWKRKLCENFRMRLWITSRATLWTSKMRSAQISHKSMRICQKMRFRKICQWIKLILSWWSPKPYRNRKDISKIKSAQKSWKLNRTWSKAVQIMNSIKRWKEMVHLMKSKETKCKIRPSRHNSKREAQHQLSFQAKHHQNEMAKIKKPNQNLKFHQNNRQILPKQSK